MNGELPQDDNEATRTSVGAATLLRKDRLLANRYRIISPVGAGGMGLVYRAHDERLDLDVAVKVLRPERAPDQEMLERFERELVLAREVSHPNVVRIHDIGQDGDLHFITMDLVEGRSLRDLLEDGNTLEPEHAAAITADIADGLDAAHRKGVVHRDLKPANILIDGEGQAYISDFGVARSLHAANLTVTGMIVGSPDYLAPEQARGDEIDGRTDIYALGLILYEMLSGELPFRGGTIEELIAQRTTAEPRDIAAVARVPRWLRQIIYRCLRKDPDDRFATAGDLAAALRAHSAPAFRLPKSAVRRTGVGVTALGILALAVFGFQAFRGEQQTKTLRLAVAPLANETGQTDLQWLTNGVNDMLASQFAGSAGVEFIESARISETLSDLRIDPASLDDRTTTQLGDLLSVDRIVTGAMRRSGNKLRIDGTIRRGDGSRTRPLVAESPADEPHTLIQSFASAVRDALAVAPEVGAGVSLSSSPEALEAYAIGLGHLNQADAPAAIPLLEIAVEADPGFALGWFQLARALDGAGYAERAQAAIVRAEEELDAPDSRLGMRVGALRAGLDGDYESSRLQLATLIERFPSDIATRMGLAEAYGDEGRFDEANAILDSVVADDSNHPRAWFLLGKYAIQSGDSRRAIDDYLVRDLVIQNRLGNDQGRADALNAMGIAYNRLGQLDTARKNYEQAAELRGKVGDKRGMATSLNNLARIEMISGNFDAARASLERAKQLSVELGDQAGLAAFTNTVGSLEEEAGNYAGALTEYRDALKIREALGDRRALTESYNNVGFAYYMLGELDNARLYWERALAEAHELGNRDGEMQALQSLGLLHTAQAHWQEAQKAFLEALAIARDVDYPEAEAVSVGFMGYIAALQGRYTAGLDQLDEALGILEPVGDTRGLVEFGLRRAEVLAGIGLPDEARNLLAKTAAWLEESPNLEQRADYLRLHAKLIARDTGEALATLDQAIEAARSSGSVAALMRNQLARGRQALADGDYARAIDLANAISEKSRQSGHTTIRIHSLATLAAARRASGAEALDTATELVALLDRHTPFGEAYRIRALCAEILGQDGQEENAARQRLAAANEVSRLRDNLPAAALAAFEASETVTALSDEALVDGQQ